MLLQRVTGIYNTYLIVVSGIFAVVFWGYLISLDLLLGQGGYHYDRYTLYYTAGTMGLLWSLIRMRELASRLPTRDWNICHHLAVSQCLNCGLGILVFVAASKDTFISRIYLFSVIPILYIVLLLSNRFVPAWLVAHLFEDDIRTILVGPRGKAKIFEETTPGVSRAGMGIRGIVCSGEEADSSPSSPIPFLGTLPSLESILRNQKVRQVLLLEIPANSLHLEEIIHAVNKAGARLLMVNSIDHVFGRPLSYFCHQGLQYVSLREEPLEDPLHQAYKRAFDIAISLPIV